MWNKEAHQTHLSDSSQDIISLQDEALRETPAKKQKGWRHFFGAASKAGEPDMKTDPVEKNSLNRAMISHQTEEDPTTKDIKDDDLVTGIAYLN